MVPRMRLRPSVAALPGPPTEPGAGRADSSAPGMGERTDPRLPSVRPSAMVDAGSGASRQRGAALVTAHRPQRPAWCCGACQQPYPCPEALKALAAGDLWTTQSYLANLFVTAVGDLPTVPVVDLYARFLLSVPVRGSRADPSRASFCWRTPT